MSYNILLIGDSYTARNGYQSYLKEKLNNKYNITTIAQSGAGFVKKYNDRNFVDLVNTAITNYGKTHFDVIIIYGGINDYRQSSDLTACTENAKTCLSKLRKHFSKAQIIYAYMQKENAKVDDTYNKYVNALNITSNDYDIKLNASNWLNSNNYVDDNLHPNNSGYIIIANKFATVIKVKDDNNNNGSGGVKYEF